MSSWPTADQRLFTLRLVHVSLCMGVVILAAVLIALAPAGGVAPMPPAFRYIAVGVAVVLLVLSFLLPTIVAARWRRQIAAGTWPVLSAEAPEAEPNSEAAWWRLYFTRWLLTAAPLEGAAFFQFIAYYTDGLPLYLGVAGAMLVLLLLQFPTRNGVEAWVAAQREQVEMARQDRL
jgi:hypothetical protein